MQKTPIANVLIGAALLPGLLAAQECPPPTISIAADGSAEFRVPDAEALAARDAAHGAAPGSDHALLIRGDEAYWIGRDDLAAARVALGEAVGRLRYVGPDHCAPRGLGIEIAETSEVAPGGGIQPLSGVWSLEVRPLSFEGCPAVIRDGFPVDMAALPVEAREAQSLVFEVPFHPGQLRMSREVSTDWQAQGENRWQTSAMEEVFAQAPSHGGRRSELLWTLTVESPGRITHRSEMHVVLPPEAASLFGTTDCSGVTTAVWTRVGD